jgi:hypothetical protein
MGVDVGICSEARMDAEPTYGEARSHLGKGRVLLTNCLDANNLMVEQS